jgi:hypothetical protein
MNAKTKDFENTNTNLAGQYLLQPAIGSQNTHTNPYRDTGSQDRYSSTRRDKHRCARGSAAH